MDEEKKNQDIKSRKEEELEFTVMPKEYHGSTSASVEPERPKMPLPGNGAFKKYWKVGLIALVALLIIGFGGYAVANKLKSKKQAPPVNPIVVPEAPTEDLDSDKDGLTDSEEQKKATNPKLADTDGDGIADGDEVNIYKSDPLLSDTDGDGYDDGMEIARGYSPIIKSSEKASAEELQSWSDRIARFKLHEPTPTTLKLKAATAKTVSKVTYTNAVYKYTIELPSVLTFRETSEGRLVGVYVAGTNPEDEVLSDPISISLAVKVAAQTLKDWIGSQYQASNYEFLQDRDINGIYTVRLVGVKDETCAQNKTFFPRDNTIFIVTWTCNQYSPFSDLYEQIVQSFKFN